MGKFIKSHHMLVIVILLSVMAVIFELYILSIAINAYGIYLIIKRSEKCVEYEPHKKHNTDYFNKRINDGVEPFKISLDGVYYMTSYDEYGQLIIENIPIRRIEYFKDWLNSVTGSGLGGNFLLFKKDIPFFIKGEEKGIIRGVFITELIQTKENKIAILSYDMWEYN